MHVDSLKPVSIGCVCFVHLSVSLPGVKAASPFNEVIRDFVY